MFTIYNQEEKKFQQVEEPDSSLSYTYADYLTWKFEEQVELIRGRLFKMSPAPTPRHQQISISLSSAIYGFLKGKTCKVFAAPFDVRLPVRNKRKDDEITTVVQPDICVVCDESKIDARGCIGAPDVVIEILSPGNTEKEVRLKFELYEEAGVKEYWIVYPAEENIAVFTLDENGKYGGAQIYAGSTPVNSKAVNQLSIQPQQIFN